MEKKTITRSDWASSFNLIGRAKITEYTMKLNERSEKSNWVYNSLNLGVDCGEKYGIIYCEAMGGYSEEKETKIYAHGKKSDGTDDFDNRIIVDWEDRMNEDILDSIGDLSFITVGLEKTSQGKTFYKKFLSWYDAIEYINEHLEDGMVVNVKGSLKYSEYNNNTQCRRQINSIVLSKFEEEKDFKASFQQTILLDKESISLTASGIDKENNIIFVDGRVLDYVASYNGVDVKGQFPFKYHFEFLTDFSDLDAVKNAVNVLLKVKKDITQITFEGYFISSGATTTVSWDDVPQDIKDLVAVNIFTKEEALKKCTANTGNVMRMVITKPTVKLVGEEKTPVLQKFERKYTEDDLYLDYVFKTDDSIDDDSSEEEVNSWLNSLT